MILSIAISVFLAQTDAFQYIFSLINGFGFLGIIGIGFFFTSVFTVPPAIVALGQLSLIYPPVAVVLLGALGAVIGDYLLFRFVKDRISTDISYFLRNSTRYRRLMRLATQERFRYVALVFALFIIASPLPDETALTLLGVSHSRLRDVLIVMYIANALGVAVIVLAAQGIAAA